MKTLLLMRHAKSSWDTLGLSDFERTLNERGKKDAPEMGKRIHKKGFKPDLIVSSPAKRAIKTAKYVAHELNYKEDHIELETSMYEASIDDLVYLIRHLDDHASHVLLVGHNPSFTSLIGYLTDSLIENMPTAGVAFLSFDCATWKQVSSHSGKVEWFDFPKNND